MSETPAALEEQPETHRPLHAFWVEFEGRGPACVQAVDEEAARVVAATEASATVTGCRVLPYPANPRLGPTNGTPSFCWTPRECAGRTCCPKSHSCVD